MTMARTIPGQSITQRLMTRVSSRPQLGARPSFFARLGVEDPLAVDPAVHADSQKEMFSFLSSADYYRERRASRFHLMSRIMAGPGRSVVGERIRALGPSAAHVRPSLLASLGGVGGLETFIEPVSEVEGVSEDENVAVPVPRWGRAIEREALRARASTNADRQGPTDGSFERPGFSEQQWETAPVQRPAPRPLERAMLQRVESVQETPVVRAMAELGGSLIGRSRVDVLRIVERVQRLAPEAQLPAARRAVRKLRGFASAEAQALVERVDDETSKTPMRVAGGRLRAPGRVSKGLRPVLSQSPALMALAAPTVEPTVEADPVATARRRVRGPEQGRIPTATARAEAPVAAAREQARTQQVSGRAGPMRASSPTTVDAPTQQTPRPTEWMASLAVAANQAPSTTDVAFGMAAAGAKAASAQGTARISMRSLAGEVERGQGISTGATGWLRDAIEASPRRAPRIPGPGPLSVLAPSDDIERVEPEQRLPAQRTARPATRSRSAAGPSVEAPTVRALRRQRPSRTRSLSASPVVSTRAPTRAVQGRTSVVVSARAPTRAVQGQTSVASTSPRPVSTAKRGPQRAERLDSAVPVSVKGASAVRPSAAQRTLPRLRSDRDAPSTGGVLRTPASRRGVPTLRAAARSAVSRRSLSASPVQTALRVAEQGETYPVDAVTGLSKTAVPAPVAEAAGSRVPSALATSHESLVDTPMESSARAVQRVSARQRPSERLASSGLSRAGEGVVPRTLEGGPQRPSTRLSRERGLEPVLAIPAVAPDSPPTAGTQAAQATQRPQEHSRRPARSDMTVTAAARGEAVVRRSAAGALLSPSVVAHVAHESEAVESAVVGPEAPAERAARRMEAASPVLGTADPAKETRRPLQTPSERAARRGEDRGSDLPVQARRGILAPVPTAYLEPTVAPQSAIEEPQAAGVSSVSPTRIGRTVTNPKTDRPSARALARSTTSTRLDEKGQAVLSTGPTAYVRVASELSRDGRVPSRAPRASGGRFAARSAPPTFLETAERAQEVPMSEAAAPRRVRMAATARLRRKSLRAATPTARDSRRQWVHAAGRPARPMPSVGEQRPAIPSAPTARVATRRGLQPHAKRRSTLARAVNRTDLQSLLETSQPRDRALQGREVAAPGFREARPVSPEVPEQVFGTAMAPEDVSEEPRRSRLTDVLRTVAPAVVASGRMGRSLLTVDAARRAVGDGRGRRANVQARLVQTSDGRIVRGEARRVSGPGQRRPLATPESVVLGSADFESVSAPNSSAGSAVEWSERRAGASREPRGPSRVPALRVAERVEGPSRYARARTARPVGRTARAVSGQFVPTTVLSESGRDETPAVPRRDTRRRRPTAAVSGPVGRPLDRTWSYLDETPGLQPRPRRMTTAAPEGALAVDSTQGDYEAQEPPGWARRAVEGTPVMSTEPRSGARKGGSLITALARASNAEDVVQVIMERGGAATGGELPGAAAQLVRSIARNASAAVEESAPATLRQDRRTERGGTVSPRAMKSVRRQVLRSRSRKTQHSSSAAKGSPTSQGLGANNVMKLADKLLKLIHLAESNRRSEAQAQVRMAEDTAQARAEGGVGGSDPESTESESMNIQTLQQEVLESVLSAIELLQERREGDPDGRHEWW